MNFYWPYTGGPHKRTREPWYVAPVVLVLLAVALIVPERKP